jgi:phage terminase large subunit
MSMSRIERHAELARFDYGDEWLDESDLNLFERMRRDNPKRYKVAGLGEWGKVDGMVYERWREAEGIELNMLSDEFRKLHPKLQFDIGLDFGYTNDPSALWVGFIDMDTRQIFVWDEMYEKGLQNAQIAAKIKALGYGKDSIVGDNESKSIDNLHDEYGIRITKAEKGPDSIIGGIQWIQDYEIVVHPRCVNFITELENYGWKTDKLGNKLNKPDDDYNHLMDAMRYALEKHMLPARRATTMSREGLGI